MNKNWTQIQTQVISWSIARVPTANLSLCDKIDLNVVERWSNRKEMDKITNFNFPSPTPTSL